MKKTILAFAASVAGCLSAMALTPASFPGGADAMAAYIEKNRQYPPTARANGIEGVVNVAFTVNKDGSIGNIRIIRMVDPDLEGEAIRLVKQMPAWTPASDNGSAVESTAEVSVPFTLE